MDIGVEGGRPMAGTNRFAMKSLGLSPEAMKERRVKQRKRYLRRNRSRILEYERAFYRGTHRMWWTLACRKAGIDI